MQYYPLNFGSREELDLELEVIDGRLPTDLGGYLFVNSVAGTVNYATPPPENWPDGSPCDEYGATVLNGDGLLYRFDFSERAKVKLKSKILKTACYYADAATRYGTDYYSNGLHFASKGLSRTHNDLGTRNQVNTAIVPFRFRPEDPTHLSVTFDAGRPHVIDPVSMEIVTPIGKQPEWLQNFPDEMQQVFPMIYATAHPCFDPYTFDYYAVNYQKSLVNLITNIEWDRRLMKAANFVLTELENFANWILGKQLSPGDLVDAIREFVPFLNDKHVTNHKKEFSDHYTIPNTPPVTSELRLVHWKGGKMNSWTVVDADGLNISISQTMHQMDLTEDYIVLSDSTLKFAMDMLMSLPFGHNDRLNSLLRRITTHTISPTTKCYIVRRADLTEGKKEVQAVRFELPHETIHFSLDYLNPEGRITLYAGHNSAICGGEWVRPYDRLAVDPEQSPAPGRIGTMATSVMDISRVGKHVINGVDGELLESQVIHHKGFGDDRIAELTGPHTWGAGLSTFREQYSVAERPARIRQIYQQFDGLDADALTQFIYQLYKSYNEKYGLIPANKILEYHRFGIPGCLCRIDTETMELADYYLAGPHENLQSLQFVPRQRVDPLEGPERDTDGYIAALFMVADPEDLDSGYSRQLYLFDAAKLAAGPVCKLSHDKLAWSLTIHSLFCAEIAPPSMNYRVDIPEDYDWVLSRFVDETKRNRMRDFLNREVYPHYR
ncbi:hypothetical protein CEQ90_07995 [Lewinellaceae bacterium SD302]|nr:hypothetical protein CEQ90_07995 [Lewinellaceae bacterium SD302]